MYLFNYFVLVLALSWLPISLATLPTQIPPTQSKVLHWIQSRANACLEADDLHRVNANGECLAIQTYYSTNQMPEKNPRLLIFIHGDVLAGGADYLKYQATEHVSPNTVAVVMIRPGYYDSYGNYSTGESHAFDCYGGPCDGYRPKTIATLAAAVQELKKYYHPSCTILVGHSGGAIMSGILLGKYPQLANGAVLASVTNDIHALAKKHDWGDWPNSLSPADWINKIPTNDFITIVSGTNDKITFPELAQQYYSALKQAKIHSKFISVKNGTHDSIVFEKATEFNQAIEDALMQCPN